MLKRILSGSIALVATIVSLMIYWIVFMPWLHLPFRNESWLKLAIAIIALMLATCLFARRRTWSALLFLLGSIPIVLVNIEMCGWEWRMDRESSTDRPVDDPRLAFLFPSDNEHSVINAILHYSIYFSAACLLIVFFWYFFRVIDQHLTKRWS